MIALMLGLFPVTLFTWFKFFGWFFNLLFAAKTQSDLQPKWKWVVSGGFSGLFAIATDRGQASQWLGFFKSLFWAASSFTAMMLIAGLLFIPNETDCGTTQQALGHSIALRFECLTRVIGKN
ncbi:hypothetical protein KDD17_16950 [Sulfitobacter albidus]|uniref:Uncharacterized protein n=1 Tax=Sulfitobacter albidus TaxID=2829501 RepID=A0A975PPB3_9RHOB|nr:hypothetical protein [Sulfitobacter albidus]QUJ78185.1 hypothetical protein KDD17_16950 [Sulfitobacter albidus]